MSIFIVLKTLITKKTHLIDAFIVNYRPELMILTNT